VAAAQRTLFLQLRATLGKKWNVLSLIYSGGGKAKEIGKAKKKQDF